MTNLSEQILAAVSKKSYQPLKPKALARKLGIPQSGYNAFRRVLRDMIREGRVEMGKNKTVRQAHSHGTIVGVYRKSGSARSGYVRPDPSETRITKDVRVRPQDALDAVTGDRVLVKITRAPKRGDRAPSGIIQRILERASHQFVGTYSVRDGVPLVRVDGEVFSHSLVVQDPQAKNAQPNDKVVIEVLRFPSPEERGDAVIVEVLGPRGDPGVDTLSVMRAYSLPDAFPEDVLEEARELTKTFREDQWEGREDFREDLVITIDPADARDHDDAISLTRDPKSGHYLLGVHIADVGHFVPQGSKMDREARKRATSVYLPQRVIPMFPEILSNGLASLHEGKVRFVKSVHIGYTPEGQRTEVRIRNGVIKVSKRFAYEQVMALLDNPQVAEGLISPEIHQLLKDMRDLALILRERRRTRGSLELMMPEAELDLDENGRVVGGHFRQHDLSHQMIEEFMLAANEAVAEKLIDLEATFLRRAHPIPEPKKLNELSDFVNALGYRVEKHLDRFTLQEILEKSADRPDAYAVHFAVLRSLKQATYTPEEEGHYALATEKYCHFTSPIRRYPDLSVHRLIEQWLQRGSVGSDKAELVALGEHCSLMERRAEKAERELIKLKLLEYLSERIGMRMEVIITGVADYGFFAQAEKLPVEGRVHISTLGDDYYYFDETSRSLIGERFNRRYRLGDRVHAEVVRVDLYRRQLDFRVITPPKKKKKKTTKKKRK